MMSYAGCVNRVLRVQDGAPFNVKNNDFSRHIEANYCADGEC